LLGGLTPLGRSAPPDEPSGSGRALLFLLFLILVISHCACGFNVIGGVVRGYCWWL